MEQVTITINGNMVVTEAGTSILKAAEDNGIRIPTLCNHPHLDSDRHPFSKKAPDQHHPPHDGQPP
jgi:hypothetical protein